MYPLIDHFLFTPLLPINVNLSGVSDTAQGALFAGAFSLLVLIFTQNHEERRHSAENVKWYASFFVEPAIQQLRKLHSMLIKCHLSVEGARSSGGSINDTVAKEIREAAQNLIKLRAGLESCKIYLETDELATLSTVLDSYINEFSKILKTWGKRSLERQFPAKYNNSYQAALTVLGNRLNPSSVKKYLERWR